MLATQKDRRGFLLLCISQLISRFGDSIFHIGLLWLALELTQSNASAGFIAACGYLPAIAFSLAAGVYADRVDRKKLMMICVTLQALAVGSVPVIHSFAGLSGLMLAGVTFLVSTGAAFFNPARDAFTPSLVEPSELTKANSLIQASAQIAFLAGPLAAGLLASRLGSIHLFTIDSLTFLISLTLLTAIRTRSDHPPFPSPGPVLLPQIPPSTGTTIRDMRYGLTHALKDGRLVGLLILTSLENLIIMGPALVGTPIYVRHVLGYGQTGVGAYSLMTGTFFTGMVLATFAIGMFGKTWPKGLLIVIGVILDGLTLIPLYFIQSLLPACIAMFLHGLTVPLITVPRATLIHRIVPKDLQGRVFGLVNLAVVGCTALSVAFTGLAAEIVPMDRIYLIAGLAAGGVGLFGLSMKKLTAA